MNHTKVNCSSCNRDLFIKVAKGENAPDTCMCKACSQVGLFTAVFTNKESTQKQLSVNIAAAQKQGKFREIDRAIKGSD